MKIRTRPKILLAIIVRRFNRKTMAINKNTEKFHDIFGFSLLGLVRKQGTA
jgi:hypothetical protein